MNRRDFLRMLLGLPLLNLLPTGKAESQLFGPSPLEKVFPIWQGVDAARSGGDRAAVTWVVESPGVEAEVIGSYMEDIELSRGFYE